MIGAGLGGGVGARGIIGRCLVEFGLVVKSQIAENLVGRDVVEPFVVLPNGLKDSVSADDVRLNKWPRFSQRVVVMGFGGKMDNDIVFLNELVNLLFVTDVAENKFQPIFGETAKVGLVTGVG